MKAFACTVAGLFLAVCCSIYLLVAKDYFALDTDPQATVGLAGVIVQDEFSSFDSIIPQCGPDHLLAEFCDSLEALEAAGTCLQVFLALDLVILVCYMCLLLVLHWYTHRALALWAQGRGEPRLNLLKGLLHSQQLLVLHPVCLLVGLGTWAGLADLDEISEAIELSAGLAVMIAYVFLSLFCVAVYLHLLKRSARLNLLELLKAHNQLDGSSTFELS